MFCKQIKKILTAIIIIAFCLGGCYSAQGNKSLTAEDGKNKIASSNVIKIDAHNITFNNDVDVYAGNDKIGDISGKFIAIWDTLKFTSVDGNIIRMGKQNAYLLFDNWTVYDEDERMLFIMKEKFNLISVSYCPTADCGRQKPHFKFGENASPTAQFGR